MRIAPHLRTAAALAVTLVLLVACGDPDAAPAATTTGTVAGTVAETIPEAAPATSAAPIATVETSECPERRKTMEVATEAFYAQFGRFPGSERELVEQGFLREATGTYSVDVDTGEITRIPGVPCPPESAPATSEPMTVDRVLAEMGEDGVAMIGGAECAREFAEIALAGERFIAREGRDPTSLEELAGDLAIEPVLWAYDAEAEALVPADGSPCPDLFGSEAEQQQVCDAERTTLQVAVEAYTAQYGGPPADEATLVGDFLRVPAERYDLDPAGRIVPVPGGECDTAP